MRYAILGPVELSAGERRLGVEGRRQTGLLLFLLTHANQAVSADRLIEAVWGDQPPEGARKRLRMAIARLRQTLNACAAATALRTVADGYAFDVAPGELDLDVFAARTDDGRRALDHGDAAAAFEQLHGALALWRGPPLADVSYVDWAQPEIRRLEELRLVALEYRIDAELQLARHDALVPELEDLVDRHRNRERFVEQLMVALYRCARQADALDVYQRTRAYLSAELGLEPGPKLKAIQAQVLAQAPSLDLVVDFAHRVEPRTQGAPSVPTGLPARRVDIVGRGADALAVTGLLHRDDVRLLTVTGAGGVGKTTLAIEVAHRLAAEFVDGAVLCDLSGCADAGAVTDAVLHALGCSPAAGETAAETLRRQVAAREQLLVIDNLEHVIDVAAPLVTEVLDAARTLKLIATSRVALNIRAEWRYPLDPLALPDSSRPASVTSAPATALFIARVLARDPAFDLTADSAAAIATVCARVGGLPLAIELAAARAGALSPQEIAGRLDSVLTTLGSGRRDACQRQRTLRATLDWSYGLLDEVQRATFAKLSVFAGGCTIEAAERVTGTDIDVLETLMDHSMLTRRVSFDGTTRLAILEPIREYAGEHLARLPAEAEATLERHSRYFTELAESIAPQLVTRDQLVWQRRLDDDADNLHDVLERASRAGQGERVLRLAIALQEWWRRGRGPAGRAWIERGLAVASRPPARLRADALTTLSLLCLQQGEIAHALGCASQALKLHDDTGDRHGKTVALVGIAICRMLLGDDGGARTAASDAVQNADDLDAWPRGYARVAQALAAPDPASAAPIAAEAARYLQQAGDLRAQAWLYGDLGYRALEYGALDRAHELIGRSMRLAEQLDDRVHHTFDIAHFALWSLESGDEPGAAAGLSTALTRCSRYGIRRPIPEALVGLAAIAANAGDAARAAELAGAAAALRADEPLTDIEQRLHHKAMRRSRDEDGAHAWERSYATGRRCTLEQAVVLGLEAADRCVAVAADDRRPILSEDPTEPALRSR